MIESLAGLRDAALQYATSGVAVFPIWGVVEGRCECGRTPCGEENRNAGKHPHRLAPHGFKDATVDPETVRAWWTEAPIANIGTPTARGAVLDVDPRHGGDAALAALIAQHEPLPTTVRVLTGGGGAHLYFAVPAGVMVPSRAGILGPGLDVKGEGGYVLLPPSRHVSGGIYRDDPDAPMFETPIAVMPGWMLALATAAGPNGGDDDRRETDWAAELAGAPEGQRHATAARIAGHLLGKGLTAREAEAILCGFAERCSPPMPTAECRRIVRDLAARDARKAAGTRESAADGEVPQPVSATSPVILRLADIAPEPVAWMWQDRIARGKLALVIGEPGTGKTYATLDMAARLTSGASWPDGARAPGVSILLLTSEDGLADTVRPIVDRQRGDPRRVYVLNAVRMDGQDVTFTLERDLPVLDIAIQQTSVGLIIISPLSAYLGSKDSYKDAEIRGLLTPLAALADRRRVAVLGVLHLTKAATRRVLLRAQGSVAFVAQARTVLAIGEDSNTPGRRLMVAVKNNLGPQPAALGFRISDTGLTWEAEPVEGTAETLLAGDDPLTRAECREREQAVLFLRDLLAEGAVASKQVAKDAQANGIAQRTLWRAKAEIGVLAERSKGQTGAWYWMLPPQPGLA